MNLYTLLFMYIYKFINYIYIMYFIWVTIKKDELRVKG